MPGDKGPPRGGVVVVRHGATEWSEASRHTSRTDLPLLPDGRRQAEELSHILDPDDFGLVLSSPRRRARETCELAGFGDQAEICEDLREWDYGDYEGMTTMQIREQRPDWWLWRDGCPDGESPQQVAARADQVLARILEPLSDRGSGDGEGDGDGPPDGRGDGGGAPGGKPAILFAHGHILRVLAARWIELDVTGGSRLLLKPAALGVLGHERDTRVIEGWNLTTLS